MKPRIHPRGYTLVEVVMATGLAATVLVPAMALMRDSQELGRTIETRNIMTTLCVSKIEEQLGLAAATFTSASTTGNFATEGYSTLRFDAVRSDTVSGAISGRLMVITVTVFDDLNGNNVLNVGEPSVVLVSKVAKMAVYENAAN